ncbi:hypothetical protein BSKO_01476 [Bryopsis sp. KO-2023]|nr:hypothetical protein BSKO_01476 [Bryopsis sp. KO-2023]
MAPKKKADPKAKKGQDKAKIEAKKKVVEDKTFGMKNKNKSAKVQQFIQKQVLQVENQGKKAGAAVPSRKDKKKAEEERQKELDALFKVAYKQPKVPAGVDPKSILCEAFKHGQCSKGFKCKFAHDLNVGRKTQKIDLFSDQRDEEEDEGMANWDQDELEKVVKQKHAGEKTNQTKIICKYFLDAVENKLYGWFWKCPNGTGCQYRHALPPGYVLKSQMKELLDAEKSKQVDVSEQIEKERQAVEAVTRITEEVFKQWHAKKFSEKMKLREEAEKERQKKGILNGREIFLQQGFTAVDDASASEGYNREVDEEAEIQRMEKQAAEAMASAKANAGAEEGAPSSTAVDAGGPSTTLQLNKEEEDLFLDDDDDLGDDELEELEAQIAAGQG